MKNLTKSTIDYSLTILVLPLVIPLIALISIAIKAVDGGPIFFTQLRIGKNERPFKLIKFRTMADDSLESPAATSDSDGNRITRLGRFLRSTSLDELPSLLNVMSGQLSLVGPRPLLPQYIELYTKHQRRRHEVKPGITGLAQVSGRNKLEWSERLELDVIYVDSRTTWFDAKIILRTVYTVLARKGISSDGYATSPPFTGEE